MIKDRVIQLLEIKGIAKEIFYVKIGMTSASFRGNAKKTPLNSNAIENIISEIPDINPDWLLTGQGSMLRTTTPAEPPYAAPQPPNTDVVTLLKEQLKEKEVEVKSLNQEIGELKSDNRKLQEQVMGLDQRISKLSMSLSRFQLTAGDAPSVPAPL